MGDRIDLIADAGREAGLGHVSRSSAVAVALRCHGLDTRCYAYGAEEPFERDGISWTPLRDDNPSTTGRILVLDTYRLPREVVARVGKSRRLVVLHDYGEPPEDVALVITVAGTPSADEPQRLIGPAYAALRPVFWGMPARQLSEGVTRILVTTGAGQLDEVGCNLARALADSLPKSTVTLVRGPHAALRTPKGVRTLDAPESLLQALLESDLVVSGAGQTMLEAAATGTPCVALPLVDNQRRQGLRLGELGAVRLVDPPSVDDVTAAVAELTHDLGARLSLSRAGQRTVDGYGALRIAFQIAQLVERHH